MNFILFLITILNFSLLAPIERKINSQINNQHNAFQIPPASSTQSEEQKPTISPEQFEEANSRFSFVFSELLKIRNEYITIFPLITTVILNTLGTGNKIILNRITEHTINFLNNLMVLNIIKLTSPEIKNFFIYPNHLNDNLYELLVSNSEDKIDLSENINNDRVKLIKYSYYESNLNKNIFNKNKSFFDWNPYDNLRPTLFKKDADNLSFDPIQLPDLHDINSLETKYVSLKIEKNHLTYSTKEPFIEFNNKQSFSNFNNSFTFNDIFSIFLCAAIFNKIKKYEQKNILSKIIKRGESISDDFDKRKILSLDSILERIFISPTPKDSSHDIISLKFIKENYRELTTNFIKKPLNMIMKFFNDINELYPLIENYLQPRYKTIIQKSSWAKKLTFKTKNATTLSINKATQAATLFSINTFVPMILTKLKPSFGYSIPSTTSSVGNFFNSFNDFTGEALNQTKGTFDLIINATTNKANFQTFFNPNPLNASGILFNSTGTTERLKQFGIGSEYTTPKTFSEFGNLLKNPNIYKDIGATMGFEFLTQMFPLKKKIDKFLNYDGIAMNLSIRAIQGILKKITNLLPEGIIIPNDNINIIFDPTTQENISQKIPFYFIFFGIKEYYNNTYSNFDSIFNNKKINLRKGIQGILFGGLKTKFIQKTMEMGTSYINKRPELKAKIQTAKQKNISHNNQIIESRLDKLNEKIGTEQKVINQIKPIEQIKNLLNEKRPKDYKSAINKIDAEIKELTKKNPSLINYAQQQLFHEYTLNELKNKSNLLSQNQKN